MRKANEKEDETDGKEGNVETITMKEGQDTLRTNLSSRRESQEAKLKVG